MTRWYENGELMAKGNFNFKNGNYTYWIDGWYPNGNLSKKVRVTDGTGKAVEYYKCGKRFMEYELKGEIEHGKWAMWYKNGKIHTEGEYFNGVMHGRWIEYYDNGEKKSDWSFNKGHADGKWITWDKNGKIESVKIWKDGVLLEEK